MHYEIKIRISIFYILYIPGFAIFCCVGFCPRLILESRRGREGEGGACSSKDPKWITSAKFLYYCTQKLIK